MKKCGVPSGRIGIIAERYHTFSLFTFPYYLNKKSPLKNSRTTKIDAVPPCFSKSELSLQSVPISTQARFNGRTRDGLPIDHPAPRPCSADPDLPPHTNRGSLKGFACLLFSSQLLSTIHGHYSLKVLDLSTFKMCDEWKVGADVYISPYKIGNQFVNKACRAENSDRSSGTQWCIDDCLSRKRIGCRPMPTYSSSKAPV